MSGDPNRPRPAVRLVSAFLLLVCSAALLVGCGYPTISEQAQTHARMIENLTDYERPEQVAQARQFIEADFSAGRITAEERDALFVPLDLAAAGKWDEAQTEALDLIRAQAVYR